MLNYSIKKSCDLYLIYFCKIIKTKTKNKNKKQNKTKQKTKQNKTKKKKNIFFIKFFFFYRFDYYLFMKIHNIDNIPIIFQ